MVDNFCYGHPRNLFKIEAQKYDQMPIPPKEMDDYFLWDLYNELIYNKFFVSFWKELTARGPEN